MTINPQENLSRRERQTMEIVYRLGEVTVNDILENLEDAPGYSAMRACMRVLEEKGHLCHKQDGPRFVYLPTVPLDKARQTALKGLMRNFFDNSYEQMVAALLDDSESGPTAEELDQLAELIKLARKEGR